MSTRDDRMKDTGEEWVGKLQRGVGVLIGNGQMRMQGHAEERTGAAGQNAIQVAEHTATVPDTARRTEVDGKRSSGTHGYDTFEADFRAHHQTNAAQRRGPYEHYRLVYRYGYDLGADTRYRSAEWSSVERDARPRWEERNPGTWDEFQEMIRYAWDKAREGR